MVIKKTIACLTASFLAACLIVAAGLSADEKPAKQTPHKNFSGNWKTNFADLTLSQSGHQVSGSYAYKGGRLNGTVSDNRLDYTWTQQDGKKGRGYFTISADFQRIDGRYGYDEDNSSAGLWTGSRASAPADLKSPPQKNNPANKPPPFPSETVGRYSCMLSDPTPNYQEAARGISRPSKTAQTHRMLRKPLHTY